VTIEKPLERQVVTVAAAVPPAPSASHVVIVGGCRPGLTAALALAVAALEVT